MASNKLPKKHALTDWPKSPMRAATEPDRPVYISTPFWRGQLPTMSKVADHHLDTPTPDVVAVCALAFVVQFETRDELFRAVRSALDRYAEKGKQARLRFELEWPETPWGRASQKQEKYL